MLEFGASLSDCLPLLLLPAIALLLRNALPAWAFMWAMAFAIFFGCKWLTWLRAHRSGFHLTIARSLGYLFAWPGMDAMAFCATNPGIVPKTLRTLRIGAWNLKLPWSLKFEVWSFAAAKTIIGAVILWSAARTSITPLVAGWLALIGLVLFLHFGLFHLLALSWKAAGINAQPIMRAPLLATSLAQFWGRRWNTAFHTLAHDFIFRPLASRWGTTAAGIGVFLISGLVHESVISLPARGGFGLPTAYFAMQSLGVLVERSSWGRRFGLGHGFRGWLFVVLCAGAPAFWLFHPIFIRNIILPMLHVFAAN